MTILMTGGDRIPDFFDECYDEWIECWSCGGEGYHELYDEDPLWYDEDDTETCDICNGAGGWNRHTESGE